MRSAHQGQQIQRTMITKEKRDMRRASLRSHLTGNGGVVTHGVGRRPVNLFGSNYCFDVGVAEATRFAKS